MKNCLSRAYRLESGETQLGVILGALALGFLCWSLFVLEGCIFDHKESKVKARYTKHVETLKSRQKINRGLGSYQVEYKGTRQR